MVAPSQHYHRIETADMQQDTHYYLTRLDGQLARLNELANQLNFAPEHPLRETIGNAQRFSKAVRDSLSADRVDVI